MSTPGSDGAPTAAAELFARLVDDAAIFPPGNAPLAVAVRQHRELRAGPMREFVGPLLWTASRLEELRLVLDEERVDIGRAGPLELAVVVDTGTAGIAPAVQAALGDPRVDLRAVEVPLRAESDLQGAARRTAAAVLQAGIPLGCTVYVEVPSAGRTGDALDILSGLGVRAKLRTGGAEADAFPDSRAVAGFLSACLDRELGVKFTAGLHRAVRHTDPTTSFEHHGFLNLLLATHALLAGRAVDDAVAALEVRNGNQLAEDARALSADDATRVRRSFMSYGSCSVTEPVEDLHALGLISLDAGSAAPT